jgi:hypothetical protein
MMPRVAKVPFSYSPLRPKFTSRQFLRVGIFACLVLLALISLPTRASAWGCKGHQVVALLAEKHLNPRALAMAKKILAEGPIDPNLTRYCKEGGTDPLANASTWPDDIRGIRPEASPWHYIDIPRGASLHDVEKFCDPKESCVTRAITDQLAILRSADTSPQKRADALRFLIHFVGDLHQPLHAITNNDQGGNCVPVAFFDALPQVRNPQSESYAPNLHGVWDTNILERATTGITVDQVASDLDKSFHGKMDGWQKGSANVNNWARESYQLAVKNVYGKLPAPVSVEAPTTITSCADDNHVSTRMLKLNEHLVDQYQDMAVPIVRKRLAQAGVRLAMLLNRLWP